MNKDTIEKKIKEQDRRVKRSLKLMKEGLLELLETKKFSDISVKDITDKTDMNRGTFYLHYSNTSELLGSVVDDLLEEACEFMDEHREEYMSAASIRPIMEPLLELILKNPLAASFLMSISQVF